VERYKLTSRDIAAPLNTVTSHTPAPGPRRERRTQLATRTSELLLEESQPVRRLAVSASGDSAWVATASSTLRKWALDPQAPPPAASTPRGQQQRHAFLAPPSTVLRARLTFEGGAYVPRDSFTVVSLA
jgi:hypothetical protein